MRAYANMKEAHSEVKRDMAEMGIEYITETVQDKQVYTPTLELYNYAYTLLDIGSETEWMQYLGEQGVNTSWVRAEIRDRHDLGMMEKNPGRAWQEREAFWGQFMRHGQLAYTYAERLHPQIPDIVRELQHHKNTRQAVLTMYDWHSDMKNFGGLDRIPCSMHYQFLLREGKLQCNYVMRSCDLAKFFLADAFMATRLQAFIANAIGVDTGTFTHFIGSLHCFKDEMKGIF